MQRTRSPFTSSGEVESGRSGKYPQNLVDECILVFKEEDNVILSEQEAEEVLDSLGGLYLAFSKTNASRTPLTQAGGTSQS